ncbi:MAG: AI-2E family transporter [Clostridia bacterium]|nr:AI-2E family transporter [Clostridia bacterium]
MDKKLKQNLFIVLSGVALFACLINFDVILNMAGKALTLFFPIISGFLIAFVLNVPMSGFTLFLSKIFNKDKPKHKKAIKLLSLLLTYISILTVIVIIFTLIVPTTAKSLSSLYKTILTELPKLTDMLMEYDNDISQLTEYIQSLDINKIIENVFSGAGTLFSSVAGFLSTTVSVVTNTFIAIIISVYVLSYKERLKIQTSRFMKAFL